MLKVPLVSLGDTDLKVSKLGISTFASEAPSLSSEEEGGRILIESHKLGVNFWDTSDDYGTYPHIAYALKSVPRKEVVISTKTYAKSGQEAKKSLKEFFERVNTDYLDIFLLHFVKSNWIDGAHRMLRELNDIKATGIVKAIGLSTHSVIVVKEASKFKELDVIMAICCKVKQAAINKFPEHIPLEDGSIGEMFRALKLAHRRGKTVVAMKVLGSAFPPLVRNYESSINSIAKLDFVDAIVIGVRSLEEVKRNVRAILSS